MAWDPRAWQSLPSASAWGVGVFGRGSEESSTAELLGRGAQMCLAGGLEVNECLGESHGCWSRGNSSACVDTFRGYVCQCPEGARPSHGFHAMDT